MIHSLIRAWHQVTRAAHSGLFDIEQMIVEAVNPAAMG
jgi:hypothetical protein